MAEPRPISAVLITRDAARHLDRVLAALHRCAEIVVLDSGSEDDTVAIAERHGARVAHRAFDGYGPQKRAAVALARYDWVLSVDADEVLDDRARAALATVDLTPAAPRAYRLQRRTFIGTTEIRHGHWHPDRVLRLFDRRATTFNTRAVHESVPPPDRVGTLPGALLHYSYPDLIAVFRLDYHRAKAARYRADGRRAGAVVLLARAGWAFVRSYVLKQGWRDGAPGVVVALSASVNAVLGLAQAGMDEGDPA